MAGSRTLKLSILGDVDNLNKSLKTASGDVDTFGDKIGKAGIAIGKASAAAAATVGLCIGPLAFNARSRLGGRDRGGWRQTTRGDGSSESSRVHRAAVEVAAEVPLALELSLAEEATPVFTAPHGHWMARGKVCCDCLMREERRRREPRGSHCDGEMEVSSHANLEVVQLMITSTKRGHRELQVRSLTPSIHITHGIDQASET